MYVTKEELTSFLNHQNDLYKIIPPYYTKVPDFFKKKIIYMLKDEENKWHIEWDYPTGLIDECPVCKTIIPLGIGICPVCGENFIEMRSLHK